jgi:hypothetical protein
MDDTPTHTVTDEQTDGSRRDFLKKAALTTGAVALGVSSAGTAAAQDTENVLVFADDYSPRTQFRVISQLPASITVRMLRRPGGGTVPEISQPDDYIGYAIRFNAGDRVVTGGAFVFTRRVLNDGSRHRFTSNASVFASDLSLLSTQITGAGN